MTILIVVLGLLVVAVCTAGSFALRTVSRIWLRHLLERRPTGSGIAEQYLARPQRLHAAAGGATALAAFSVGTVCAVAGSVLGVGVWVVVTLTLLGVLGVAVPRAIARRFPTYTVPIGLPVLRAADVLLAPLREMAAAVIVRRADPVLPAADDAAAAHAELEDLLREGQLEGVGDATELAMISSVVQFGDKCARDVMTPRAEVFALDLDLPATDLARAVAGSGYSRVPVYRGTLDDTVGVLLAFDVLRTTGEAPARVHPVFAAAPDQACTELLRRMLRANVHLAVVRDAAGVTLGVVTLEDLLEELVGDIRDEHDEPAPTDGEVERGIAGV